MKLLTSILIFFVLGTMLTSLFYVSTMDMSGSMSSCPLMTHGESICPMDLAEHLSVWQDIFLAATPTMMLVLLAAGTLVFIARAKPDWLIPKFRPPQAVPSPTIHHRYTFWPRPLQELFATGLLHSKLF